MTNSFNILGRSKGLPAALMLASLLMTSSSVLADPPAGNLVQRLERDGRFTTLLTALEVTGLKSTVATGGTFTLFAPTDAAFAALPPGTVEALVADPPALANILLYHALPGSQSLISLLEESTAGTVQGSPLLVMREGWRIVVNRQPILFPWIPAANGVIYPIGGVLLPPAGPTGINNVADVLALDGRFTTLLAAVKAAGLGEALTTGGPFTLFAPTDEAFSKLPPGTVESLLADPDALRDVLLYHVLGQRRGAVELLAERRAETLQGAEVTIALRQGSVFVNDSRVVNANVRSLNAVIHVIDRVLLPPPPEPNLIHRLEADGRFGTLLAALQAAGLTDVLASGGPFTLFAPTDAAFAKLPAGTVEALLANPDALKNVLLYHVVSGDKSSRDLIRERSAQTLQGTSVKITAWWGRVFVNRSLIIDADLQAGNGRIHALNGVLLPR